MFLDQLRASVEAAQSLSVISSLERTIWQTAWPAHIGDAEAQELADTLGDKRKALTAQAAAKMPIGFTRPKPRITGPKKAAAIATPPPAGVVLAVTAQARRPFHGVRAGGAAGDRRRHEAARQLRHVQRQDRRYRRHLQNHRQVGAAQGEGLRLLTLEERRRRGQRSLTNVVRFLCTSWRQWILGKPTGVRNLPTTVKQFETSGATEIVERLKGIMPAPPALKFET